MSSKPFTRKTTTDVLKELQVNQKKMYGLERQRFSGLLSAGLTGSGIAGSGSPTEVIDTGFLKTAGDSMVGPFATAPTLITISGGVIDIGNSTSNYSSNIVITGEGIVADELDTILNAGFAGQWLILQANAVTPITIKHLTDNIRIPGGADYILQGQENILLKFDSITSQWVLVANFSAAAGGSGFINPAIADLKMRGFNVFLDADDDTGFISTIDNVIITKIGGATKILMDATDMEINLNLIPATSGLDIGAAGTNEQWSDASIDRILFRNNTTFTSGQTAIGTESGGELVLNSETAQPIHMRVGGGDTAQFTDSALHMQSGHNIVLLDGGTNATITKLSGLPLDIRATNGIKLTGGAVRVVDGDLNIDAGNLIVDNGATTTLTLVYGAGILDHKIVSNTGGMEYQVGTNDDHEFKVTGVIVGEFTNLGLGIGDGLFIRPRLNSNVIGIRVFDDNTWTIGQFGSILIPNQVTTTQPPTSANLDSWFGNDDDAIGSVSDFTESTGSGRHRLWTRARGEWRGIEMTIFPG